MLLENWSKLAEEIKGSYGGNTLQSKDGIDPEVIWFNKLKHYNCDTVKKAVDRMIVSVARFPNLPQLMQLCEEVHNNKQSELTEYEKSQNIDIIETIKLKARGAKWILWPEGHSFRKPGGFKNPSNTVGKNSRYTKIIANHGDYLETREDNPDKSEYLRSFNRYLTITPDMASCEFLTELPEREVSNA